MPRLEADWLECAIYRYQRPLKFGSAVCVQPTRSLKFSPLAELGLDLTSNIEGLDR